MLPTLGRGAWVEGGSEVVVAQVHDRYLKVSIAAIPFGYNRMKYIETAR